MTSHNWKVISFDHLHSFPLTPAPGNHLSILSFYEFVCFFQIPHISEVIWYLSFSDLFHLAQVPQGSSTMSQMEGVSPFLWLNNMSVCVCVRVLLKSQETGTE